MRILLTGGTGFIGQRLGVEFVRRGHTVVALVRDEEKAKRQLIYPAEIVQWKTASALKDIDAVVHLAGESIAEKRWCAKQKKKIIESRTQTTEAVLKIVASIQGRKPESFISASAIGFYGDSGSSLVREGSPAGEGFLAETCVAWETAVEKASSLVARVVSLRIGIVLGRHGGALQQMLPIFKKGVAGRLGSGAQYMSWIHLDDLVQMFCFAVENKEIKGIYNAVAPQPVSNTEFTKTLAQLLGVPAFFPAPALALRIALGEMSVLLLASQNVSSEKIQSAGFEFKHKKVADALDAIFACVEKKRGPLFHEYVTEQWFPQPVEEIFPFFSNAKNLESITPPFLQFKILKQSTPRIEEGTTFDYSLRIHGVPVKWRTLILDWKENHIFSDTQQKGPYSFWYHTHCFERLGGGTLMRDRVVYRLPLAYLGYLFAHWKVKSDIEGIFKYRREAIFQKYWK